MTIRLSFFLALFLIMSCNGKPTEAVKDKNGTATLSKSIIEGVDLDKILNSKSTLLEDMGSIVPIENIASALGIDPSVIKKVPNADANSNTCFFKWDDPNYPNTGIMMQVKKNPYPVELPEWAMVTMNGLRKDGETGLGGEFNHRYSPLNGMATEGLYNSDIGKYYWRLSDKVVLFLAFNTVHEQEPQFKMATELGSQMIKNYLDL